MHHINDPSLSIGFHLDIYHSHQCIFIVHQSSINQLLDINQWHQSNQTIYINDTWSNNLPNNQTIGIKDKPLASMTNHWNQWQHDPTISPFGIDGNTNIDVNSNYQYWCHHVEKACSTSIVNVTISPHQSLPISRHQSHQCDYISPFNINGKGPCSSWGCSPYLVAIV